MTTLRELDAWLNKFFTSSSFTDNGELFFTKQQLGKVKQMKIEMYSNDHNPPHFHVKSNCGTVDAVFALNDCTLIEGKISGKDKKIIEAYYTQLKPKLLDYWENYVISKHR